MKKDVVTFCNPKVDNTKEKDGSGLDPLFVSVIRPSIPLDGCASKFSGSFDTKKLPTGSGRLAALTK